MKAKVAILFSVLSISGFVNAAKEPLGDIESVQVVDGVEKQKIYTASKMWIADQFKSAQDVIQFDDKESGTIIAKGIAEFPCTGMWCLAMKDYWLRFTIRIDTKDGKFKTLYSDLIQEQKPSASVGQFAVKMPPMKIYVERDKNNVSKFVDGMNASLKDYVIKNATVSQSADW